MKNIAGIGLLVLLAAAGRSHADVNMQEGNWETTVEMQMEGMPFPMPPAASTITQCLTRKDMVPNTASRDQKCEIRDRQISGNTVSWKVACMDKDGKSEGEGRITYSGSSYRGVIRMQVISKGSAKPMRSTMRMKGRRLGNCMK